MLRLLVVALLAANAVFAAWTLGWLAPLARPPQLADREPERLAAQVDPQRLRVVPAPAAAASTPPGLESRETAGATSDGPGAAAAAVACLESSPLSPADADAGARALVDGGVPATRWQRVAAASVQAPWLLYAGPFADLSARRAVLAQWRRLGLAVDTLDAPAPGAPGLVLSRHGSRGAAEVARSALPDGVAALTRIVAAPAGGPPLALRIPAADAALLARLRALAPPWDAAFRPCAVAASR